MPVEIVLDASEVEKVMQRLRDVPYAMQRAVYPAVGEVMDGVKAHLAEYLSSDVPIDAKASKKAIKAYPPIASGDSIVGTVVVASKMLPLINYDVQPKAITARKGMVSRNWPDFTFSLRRGDSRPGRSRLTGRSFPFIARMPSGHLGVYYHAISQMKQAYGPTVQYHVATPEIEGEFGSRAERQFPEILARYADQALANFGGQG